MKTYELMLTQSKNKIHFRENKTAVLFNRLLFGNEIDNDFNLYKRHSEFQHFLFKKNDHYMFICIQGNENRNEERRLSRK